MAQYYQEAEGTISVDKQADLDATCARLIGGIQANNKLMECLSEALNAYFIRRGAGDLKDLSSVVGNRYMSVELAQKWDRLRLPVKAARAETAVSYSGWSTTQTRRSTCINSCIQNVY